VVVPFGMSGALVYLEKYIMLSGRKVTLCGLYLDFAGVSECMAGAKSIGLRGSDVSVILADASATSAMPVLGNTQRLQAAVLGRTASAVSGGPSCAVRVAPAGGAVTKTLLTLGVRVYDSERLEYKILNGGILVVVRCNNSVSEQVRDMLIRTGAQDLSVARESKVDLERRPFSRSETYASVSVNQCEQPGAHA
jgi:hypothetical protein